MNRSEHTVAVFARSILSNITGGERRRVEIANRLSKRGWQVTMYTFDVQQMSPRWAPLSLKVPLQKRTDNIEADFVICGDLFEDGAETSAGTFLTARAKYKKLWLMQIYRPQKNKQERALKDPKILKIANSSHMAQVVSQKHQQTAVPAIGGIDLRFFFQMQEVSEFTVLTYKLKSRVPGEIYFKDRLKLVDASRDQVDLRRRYWNCSVFANLEFADYYGWCNPVAEAMACGRACVSADSPHVRDLIIDGKTGLIAKPSAVDVKQKIELLKDPVLRKSIVKAGLEHIKQFDWPNVINHLEKAMTHEVDLGVLKGRL